MKLKGTITEQNLLKAFAVSRKPAIATLFSPKQPKKKVMNK